MEQIAHSLYADDRHTLLFGAGERTFSPECMRALKLILDSVSDLRIVGCCCSNSSAAPEMESDADCRKSSANQSNRMISYAIIFYKF